jgi:hypothetical protein
VPSNNKGKEDGKPLMKASGVERLRMVGPGMCETLGSTERVGLTALTAQFGGAIKSSENACVHIKFARTLLGFVFVKAAISAIPGDKIKVPPCEAGHLVMPRSVQIACNVGPTKFCSVKLEPAAPPLPANAIPLSSMIIPAMASPDKVLSIEVLPSHGLRCMLIDLFTGRCGRAVCRLQQ